MLGADGEDQPELVAAEARDGVAHPDVRGQPLAQPAQQLVAVVVAQGVVDLFEAVQVGDHDGDVTAGAARRFDGGGGVLLELGAVGQAGQHVVPGQVGAAVGGTAQPAHGRGGDRGQARPQAAQTQTQDQIERTQPVAHVLVDGRVRKVELQHADPAAPVVERHVDLDGPLAVLRAQPGQAGDGGATHGGLRVDTRRLAVARTVVGVDDLAADVPQAQPQHVTGVDGPGRDPVERHPVLHGEHAGGAVGVEQGFDGRTRHQRGRRATLIQPTVAGIVRQGVRQHHTEYQDWDQARRGVRQEQSPRRPPHTLRYRHATLGVEDPDLVRSDPAPRPAAHLPLSYQPDIVRTVDAGSSEWDAYFCLNCGLRKPQIIGRN